MNTDCVILAAGFSRRMGRNKMTLDIGGTTVLESCINTFYTCCDKIIVVTGRFRHDIQRLTAPYPKVCLVHNERYADGMFSSVKAGLAWVTAPQFLLTPGDYPFIAPQTAVSLISACASYAVPVYNGAAGHPILLDKLFIPGILASGHASLRHYLEETAVPRQEVPVDDIGVLTDIDTIDDLIRHRQSL